MKNMKKALALLLAGAVLGGGATIVGHGLTATAFAKDNNIRAEQPAGECVDCRGPRGEGFKGHHGGPPPHGHHGGQPPRERISPKEMSEKMAATFGLKASEILEAQNEGYNMRDLIHGAFVAKASGHSFADVIKRKTRDNYWRDVEEALGVKPENIRAVRDDVMTTKIAEKLSLEKSVVKDLVADGFHPHDIAFASVIGKLSNNDVRTVLDQKKINNSWRDVAALYNVSDRDLHQAMRDVGGPGLGFMNMGRRGDPNGGGRRGGPMMPPPPPPEGWPDMPPPPPEG